jgi:hypothetical protein
MRHLLVGLLGILSVLDRRGYGMRAVVNFSPILRVSDLPILIRLLRHLGASNATEKEEVYD